MNYLVKNKKLELKYEAGKGAWTYHIQIPNTAHIVGKWGSLKVSGTIDTYEIEGKNLFTIRGQDKLISINETIRKKIKKSGGDFVNVTLYFSDENKSLSEKVILETFKEFGVLKKFTALLEEERNEIIDKIITLKSDEKQIKAMLKFIDQLA